MLENLINVLLPMLVSLATQYPIIASMIIVMGSARIVMKPLMLMLEAIVKVTKTKKDNALLAKVKASKVYKLIALVLDYALSIKLSKAKK